MFKALSIRWKILAGLMTLSIIPMLLLTYLFSDMNKQQVRNQMDQVATQAWRFIAQTTAHRTETMMEALEVMAKDTNLLAAVNATTQKDFSHLQALLSYYRIQFGLDRVEVILADGQSYSLDLTGGNDRQLADSNPTQASSHKLASNELSKIDTYQNHLSIYGEVPLRQQHQLIGNLVAQQYINDHLAKQFRATIEAELAYHDGKKIVAASLNELKTADLNLDRILDEDFVDLTLNNRPYILYNYPLNHPTAGLLIALDSSAISVASKNMQKTLLWIVIGVISGATFIGLLISRGIAGPLNSVVRNLQEIAEGEADLTRSLKVATRDEVGILAGSFNRFVARLRDLVKRTHETADSLSAVTISIRSKFADVNQSATEQTKALENSHQSVTEIGRTAVEIADNVSNLVASVQQSAAATHELESTTFSITEQMEDLFGIISDISSSIHNLSSSNEQIDGNILELSNSAKETSLSVEHLEQATSAIEKSTEQTSQLAQQAVNQSLEGKAAVQDTIRGISGLQQLIEQAHLAIQELGERSDTIGNIVNVIAEVADQTNLLALNAAIIAAQAGEQGQGFAVVAEEIRNLAERTSVSTKEIAEIIENLQQGTNMAVSTIEAGSLRAQQEVARSHAAGEALEKLHESSLTSTEQITSIARETQKQSEENRKITQAVLGVTKMLEQIANAIGQQTASTRDLSSAAESMKKIAGRVKNSTSEQNRGSQQIAQSMEHIQQMIELIDTATREQSKRCNDVVQSVARVRQIADENADRAAAMDIVVEDLTDQAKGLSTEMGAFKV